jgi:hypothetical protein
MSAPSGPMGSEALLESPGCDARAVAERERGNGNPAAVHNAKLRHSAITCEWGPQCETEMVLSETDTVSMRLGWTDCDGLPGLAFLSAAKRSRAAIRICTKPAMIESASPRMEAAGDPHSLFCAKARMRNAPNPVREWKRKSVICRMSQRHECGLLITHRSTHVDFRGCTKPDGRMDRRNRCREVDNVRCRERANAPHALR